MTNHVKAKKRKRNEDGINEALPDEIVSKILEQTGAWKEKNSYRMITAADVCTFWRRIWRSSADAVVRSFIDASARRREELHATLVRIARGPREESGDRTWDARMIPAMLRRCVDDASVVKTDNWFDRAIAESDGGPITMGRLLDAFPDRVRTVSKKTLSGAIRSVIEFYGAEEERIVDGVRRLLEWPVKARAPRADSEHGQNGLCLAARRGHVKVMRLLLEWPVRAPKADCLDSLALRMATESGRTEAMRLLLEWPKHAPRADAVLYSAVAYGRLESVRLLLGWPVHAPRAGNGVLYCAVHNCHLTSYDTFRSIVEILLRHLDAVPVVGSVVRRILHVHRKDRRDVMRHLFLGLLREDPERVDRLLDIVDAKNETKIMSSAENQSLLDAFISNESFL